MPAGDFRHPQDMAMGKDGSLYMLEWGRDFNYAGSGINPDSGLYRIDYAKGTRTPVARATSDKDSGPAPLTVNFSSEGSEDADGDTLTYTWDFDDGRPRPGQPDAHLPERGHLHRAPDRDRLDRQVRHLDGDHHRRQHAPEVD